MIIVNFKEYTETLRELFAKRQKSEIDAYAQDVFSGGQKQKEAKEKLQREISLIAAKIKQLREQIAATEDKTAISSQIKHLKKAKQDLIGKLKKRERTSRFSILSAESKAALCTLALLRKYLTKEILENEFLQMNKNAEGNIIFNRDWFEQSSLFDDAVHIYDYVASYLQQNPEQVTSENYFNKLFDKESGLRGICRKADAFFEKQNKEKRKKSHAEIIAESRSDLELIKKYPADNLIFVRLKTPEALDYEGTAAHNCVGGGGYDGLIEKKDSGIYSLRQLMQDGELKPVVTIELNEGQIKQIKGVCNSFVAYDYSLPARDSAMMLLNKKTQAELVQDKDISESVLNAFGLFRDGKGGYLDIHNLTGAEDFELPELRITADGLKDYEWEKLKIKYIRILGKIEDSEACNYLEHLTNAQMITIDDLAVSLNLDLDKFSRLQKLDITSKNGTECCLHGKKSVLSELNLSKVSFSGAKGSIFPSVETLKCTNIDMAAFTLSIFPNLKRASFAKLDLSKINLSLPANVEVTCEDCILNEEILHLHLSDSRYRNKYNKVRGTYFDFSEYSECLNLDGLHFYEAEVMKFAPRIKTLRLGIQIPSSTRIEGLDEVENLIALQNPWNKPVMERINPQTVKNLDYNNILIRDSEFDISRYTNLKKLSGNGFVIDDIPPSVEKITMTSLFNTKSTKNDTWDFSHLPNLTDLDIHASSDIKYIVFPQQMEKLKLGYFLLKIESLDLSHCHRLNEVKLAFVAPKIKKVSLPDCVKAVEAPQCESGIGVHSAGFERNTDLRIEIPSTAHSEIIGYLREQWGNDRISIIPPEKKQIAPVLLLQNKNKRLK